MTGPGPCLPPANQACSGGPGGFPPGSRRELKRPPCLTRSKGPRRSKKDKQQSRTRARKVKSRSTGEGPTSSTNSVPHNPSFTAPGFFDEDESRSAHSCLLIVLLGRRVVARQSTSYQGRSDQKRHRRQRVTKHARRKEQEQRPQAVARSTQEICSADDTRYRGESA